MKKILILGAGVGQIPLIKRAKSKGLYTVVVSPNGDYPGFEYADVVLHCDVSNQSEVLDYAKKQCINAIATDQTDISAATVDYVARELKLPRIDCESIENFRDKSLMRLICNKYGLPTIPFCIANTVDDFDQLDLIFQNLSASKVIVKPVDSQGSRGINVVDSIQDLSKAFLYAQKYSKSSNVIIEKYIDGREVEVNSVIYDGHLVNSIIGDVYKFESLDTFSSYERKYPSELNDNILEKLRDINLRTAVALGLKTGWTHGEYIITDTGEIYLLEIGARGGGNFVGSDILRIMQGMSSDEMALRTALGDMVFYDEICENYDFCALKSFYLPCGVISSIEIDWEFINKDYIVCHPLNKIKLGSATVNNIDKTTRYTIIVNTKTRDELNNILQSLPDHINIIVETIHGQESIIWK